jgi:hypothetical protein
MITTHLEYMQYIICVRAKSDGTYKATIRENSVLGKVVVVIHDCTTPIQAEDKGMDWIDVANMIVALTA